MMIIGSSRISSLTIQLLCLIFLYSLQHDTVRGLSLVASPVAAAASSSSSSPALEAPLNLLQASNATNPVVYTKLRHDKNNLQVFRKYQLEKTHKEKEKRLTLNETFDDGDQPIREITYTYYENAAIEANSITQDDLILEALDRTYRTRLIPVYVYNYDSSKDRDAASDPKITSAARCKRDLDYLMDRLGALGEAHRQAHNQSIGPELAAFFDSFAGEEPGLLFGNYHWTGNWRQCYKRLVFDLDRSNTNGANTVAFRGRYCSAAIRSSAWDSRIKAKSDQLEGNYFRYPEQRYDYARFFRIQVGLCLPESCDSRIIDSRRADIHKLAVHKLSEPFKSYELVDLFCLPDETSKLRQIEPAGLLFIVMATVWCSMVLLATYCDYRETNRSGAGKKKSPKSRAAADKAPPANQSKSARDKVISAMSLIKNYHRLTETESLAPRRPVDRKGDKPATSAGSESAAARPPAAAASLAPKANQQGPLTSPNDLLFLNAYKVISMPLIIYGHVGMLSVHLNRFPLDYESFGSDLLFHFSSSTVFFVDWYFVTTGFITSYIMLVTRKIERNSLIDWCYSIFHRYWRLAPLYILAFWFSRSLFQHTSHGPVWDYGTSNMTIRSICRRESWLWPVFLLSNFHALFEECIMPAWYIANDMQFYIITPFILIGLSRWPLATWAGTMGLIGASISARIHRYITDPRAQPLELMRPGFDLYMRNNWDMYPTYIQPQYRIPSHLIGLLAGHYAYKVLRGEWKSPVYSARWLVKKTTTATNNNDAGKRILGAIMWLIGFQLVLSMAFATWPIKDYFPRSLEPHVKYFTAVIYGVSHSTTALGMALMFLSLIFGHFAPIRRFLTLPFWTLVSRVNYIVFLIQVEVIYWVYQSSERVPDFSGREAFKYWIQLVVLCYSISAVLTLLIELPLAHLEREFLGNWMAARSKSLSMAKQGQQNQLDRQPRNQQCELIARETSQLVETPSSNQSVDPKASPKATTDLK